MRISRMTVAANGIARTLAPTDDCGWRKLSALDYLLAALVALAGAWIFQVWQAHIGLNFGDEGLLWYAVQRTLAGQWVMRDFSAYYDPGRYLLYAGWARLGHDDGIVMLRYGNALIQAVALLLASLLLLRVLPSRWLFPLFGLAAALWMAPRHKIIDVAASVWMTFFLAWLIVQPTRRRHLLAGMQVGLLWILGRNHALYAAVAALAITVILAVGEPDPRHTLWRRLRWGAAGMAVGMIPMLLMLLVVPGMARGYWQNAVLRYVQYGASSPPLPVPWPWKAPAAWNTYAARAVGLGFLTVPVAMAVAIVLLTRHRWRGESLRRHPIFLAATVCAALEAHHQFARADLPHLAQAGFPLFLLLTALPQLVAARRRGAARGLTWGTLALLSATAMPLLCPRWMAQHQPAADYAWENLAGEQLYLPRATRAQYRAADNVVRQLRPGETVIFVPYVPGLFAVFRLWCPLPEPYPLSPETPAWQHEIIHRLQQAHTTWAMVWPDRLDGRADLGFAQTHPLVWQYLQQQFVPVPVPVVAGNVCLLHRPDPTDAKSP